MLDEMRTEAIIARALIARVAAAIGNAPSFDAVAVRLSIDPESVVLINTDPADHSAWIEQSRSTVGFDANMSFLLRPLGPSANGAGMVAARGCGTLDFQRFQCGCRAAQIPGEDDWQLIRAECCRFAAEQHLPASWPVDLIKRPAKWDPAPREPLI